MKGGEYCKNCKFYPDCKDLDNDTEVFDCSLKVEKEYEN